MDRRHRIQSSYPCVHSSYPSPCWLKLSLLSRPALIFHPRSTGLVKLHRAHPHPHVLRKQCRARGTAMQRVQSQRVRQYKEDQQNRKDCAPFARGSGLSLVAPLYAGRGLAASPVTCYPSNVSMLPKTIWIAGTRRSGKKWTRAGEPTSSDLSMA